MNPETQNLIHNTIGNPAGVNPNIAPPPKSRFSGFIDSLKNRRKLILTLIAIIFLVGVLIFTAATEIQKRFFPESKPFELFNKPPALSVQNAPSILIKTKKKTYSLNEPIQFTAIADSQGQQVTGFDVLINFDSEYLSLSDKKSPGLKDFQYYGSNKDSIFQNSAVLKPDSTTPQIFKDQMLFEFEFIPKKKGKTELKILYTPGSTSDSNLINNQSVDILGNARGTEITIE